MEWNGTCRVKGRKAKEKIIRDPSGDHFGVPCVAVATSNRLFGLCGRLLPRSSYSCIHQANPPWRVIQLRATTIRLPLR